MNRVLGAALLAAAAATVGQGAPGLTALGPVRRAMFPRLAGLGHPGHVALTFDDGPDAGYTPGAADAALGALPWLLGECGRRGLTVGPVGDHG